MKKNSFGSEGDFNWEESLRLLHAHDDIVDYSKVGLGKILRGEHTMGGETKPLLIGYTIVDKELWESVKHKYGF